MLSLSVVVTVNEDLLELSIADQNGVCRVYEPAKVMVVQGAGRKNKPDLIQQNIERDCIPVLSRRGGGETVVLSPGMIVLALVKDVASPFCNREYTGTINS